MSKKVWFALPVDLSPDNLSAEESPLFQYQEFSKLKEDSQSTEGSDLSHHSFKQAAEVSDLSQYSFKSSGRSSFSTSVCSQYSIHSKMEKNTTGETVSTNDSQDISSSQQESGASDGLYCYEDDNESSSLRDSPHEEVVNSAIMEVSGELMLGKLTPSNKHPSVCSESSDISDDDMRHRLPGGSIVKYPESSTGLSDNDWNPYATESDTNQTPRSPRSTASDDNRVGFISKANIDVKAPSERGGAAVDTQSPREADDATGHNDDSENQRNLGGFSANRHASPEQGLSDNEDVKEYATLLSEREDLEQESPDTAPDTARSAYTEGSRSGRQSSDSLRSEETKRESSDFQSGQSEPSSARHSLETGPLDSYRRVSTESTKSLSQDSADNSSQPSVETVRARGSHDGLERGELNSSGRVSVDSHLSQRSDRSKGADHSEYGQRSTSIPAPSSVRFDRSDRLDRLSNAAGDNLKELMQFESAQRSNSEQNGEMDMRLSRGKMNYPVSSTRLTARIERSPERVSSSYQSSKDDQPPERSSTGYITIAERERLIADSPEPASSQNPAERRSFERNGDGDFSERAKPLYSDTKLQKAPNEGLGRSPSEVSMRRVSSLFEETKRQVREAVALPRPDPSGSEERFPLRERMTWNQHEDSFIGQAGNRSGEAVDKQGSGRLEKSRESEAARSLTSEEVARVLSKYADYEKENSPKLNEDSDQDSGVKVSAFDSVDRHSHTNGTGNSAGFDDELSERVKAILADSHQLESRKNVQHNHAPGAEYIPNTIDYSRLHRDLEEIQDSLHDIPKSRANDSLPLHLRKDTDYVDSPIPPEFVIKSMETTGSALTKSRESGISEYNGRESAASEYGRRLVWDHGADLQYDNEYDGKFLGTNTSTETLSHGRKRYGYESTETLVVRPDSVATNATDNDVLDIDSEGTRTLTGSDITRAERIVQQVMNRQAEGDLKENVEDIIARYRDERRDLDGRYQVNGDSNSQAGGDSVRNSLTGSLKPDTAPTAAPRYMKPKPLPNSETKDSREVGLAERVYKILTAETDNPYDVPDEQGDRSIVSTVSNILAKGCPQQQVNGILTETLAQENEMLKKIASREASKMTDSSLDDSGVNDTEESYALEDEDVRKRLQWSQMSSPEKGDKSYMSDLKALREVTAAPYSSLSNAKSLLSTQLKKMSERNFDKSVELRTPFRQAIQCWPVHGVERTGNQSSDVREAWMPRSGTEMLDRDKKFLGSERFYITKEQDQAEMGRPRTFSDPFDVSHSRHISDREPHSRSRSEEATDVHDLSRYSVLPQHYSATHRKTASSPARDPHSRSRSEEATDVHDYGQYSVLPQQYTPSHRRTAASPASGGRQFDEFMTPKMHKPEEWSYEYYTTSLSDSSDPRNISDSSGCHGNKGHSHSYQGPDKLSDPDNDQVVYEKFQRSVPIKSNMSAFRSRSWDRGLENKSPVKILADVPEYDDKRFQKSVPMKSNTSAFRSQSLDRDSENKSPVKMLTGMPEYDNKKLQRSIPMKTNMSAFRSKSLERDSENKSPVKMLTGMPEYNKEKLQRSIPMKSNMSAFRSKSLERDLENKSPVKMLTEMPEHKSQSETRQKSFKVKFTTPEINRDVDPRVISEYSERQLINRISRRNDDVYDLLTDKGQSRLDVQELRTRLNDLQQERADNRKMLGNYGDGLRNDAATVRTKKPVYMRSRHNRPVISPTDSDTSGSKKAARPRPYRPAGSRDMYYTESGDDTNESATTIESTHPGSDDAIPPYIPKQYLGSRLDEPKRHPTGIYGLNNHKDDLSTIDEQSAKDEKEKALSASTGSQKDGKADRDEDPPKRTENGSRINPRSQFTETGYQTGSIDAPTGTRCLEPAGNKARSRPSSQEEQDKGDRRVEQFMLKSREEYLREFEEREQERRLRYALEHRDPMGTSTRSDPGSALEELGPSWEYRESGEKGEFKVMEPEPCYPQDRLRYSRSRSDTDLTTLSPAESQRYSSPLQPGTRFMELSTQPSPIFHQDSMTLAPRMRASRDTVQEQMFTPVKHRPADLPRMDDRRTVPELPRVDDRRPTPELARVDDRRTPDLARVDDRRRTPELARVDDRRTTPELARVDDRRPTAELPRVDDRRSSPSAISRREGRPVVPLESGEEQSRPLEAGNVNSRSKGHPRSQEMMDPVDLGADPRRLGDVPRSRTPRTPVYEKQKEMEAELEKMNKELTEQVKELKDGNRADLFPEDSAPMSKKAQVLREVLENEYVEGIPPNINDMWTRFKERFDQSVSESSLNSTRLDALSGLIQNPTHHLVNSFIQEKQKEAAAQKKACEESAEKIREERKKESERLKRMSEVRAVEERSERRREMRMKHGLSEEESNGSITELLVENEKKKERSKKKENRTEDEKSSKRRKTPDREKREKKGQVDKETETEIKSRARVPRNVHSDSMDTLFSIPEDASFEQSPTKSESELRSRQRRQRHVIDPLMKKLRDKIKLQRVKIDKERRKELQRVQKLKKLEMLLNAKRSNHLSDKAIDVELQNVSSTTSVHSESTLMSTDSTINTLMSSSHGSDHSSDISTTLKDSTCTPIKLQVKRYPELDNGSPKRRYHDTDSTESSDFSNIIVEKLPAKKSERRKNDKKSGSKERRVKLDENGQKIRKERSSKKKNEVFGVEFSDEDLDRQVKRYERYVSPQRTKQTRHEDEAINRQLKKNLRRVSPERHKQLRDASTMYPSPITVSPPQRRRTRDVLMRSEAIQTSPSIRSSSPTHSYDEVPVAPVPTMGSNRSGKRTLRRRPSPSPPRSASATRSTTTSPPRRSSKSPPRSAPVRNSSKSPVRGVSVIAPPPQRREISKVVPSGRRKESSMWKPESEISPPENSMFTPESGENVKPVSREEATTWFIPMKPSQPWRQPLKERQAFSVRQENWEPTSVSQKQWKNMVQRGVHNDQGDPNDVSRDTKFDLDPEGQPINLDSEEDSDDTELDLSNSKPLSKMSLQEAFAMRKQVTISNLRRRQKRLNLAAEQRKMEVYLKMERDRLFTEERKKEANPEAHPYSNNLYRPARRVISKEEMKELTVKRYKKLPEVIEKQKQKKREDEYSLNRIKARLFNRKVQKHVLVKAEKWGR